MNRKVFINKFNAHDVFHILHLSLSLLTAYSVFKDSLIPRFEYDIYCIIKKTKLYIPYLISPRAFANNMEFKNWTIYVPYRKITYTDEGERNRPNILYLVPIAELYFLTTLRTWSTNLHFATMVHKAAISNPLPIKFFLKRTPLFIKDSELWSDATLVWNKISLFLFCGR